MGSLEAMTTWHNRVATSTPSTQVLVFKNILQAKEPDSRARVRKKPGGLRSSWQLYILRPYVKLDIRKKMNIIGYMGSRI